MEREAVTVPADHVILVAPWFSLQDLEDEEAVIAEEWLNTTIDFTKIKPKVKRITAFLSDNDPYVPFEENQKTLVEQLDAEVILVQGKGHFSEDDGMTQFPLLEEYL